MSHWIDVPPAAEADIGEAMDRFDRMRPGMGREFIGELDHILDQLRQYPESVQRFEQDCRRAVMRRFRYAVVYRIVTSTVQVVAVLPCRVDPTLFAERAARRAD